jgi:hypothetical protein
MTLPSSLKVIWSLAASVIAGVQGERLVDAAEELVLHLDAAERAADVDLGVRGPVLAGAVVQGAVVDPVPGAVCCLRDAADQQAGLHDRAGRGGLHRGAQGSGDRLADPVRAGVRAEGDVQPGVGRGGVEGEDLAAGVAVGVLGAHPDRVVGACGQRGGGLPAEAVLAELAAYVAPCAVRCGDIGDPAAVVLDGDLERLAGVRLAAVGDGVGDLGR